MDVMENRGSRDVNGDKEKTLFVQLDENVHRNICKDMKIGPISALGFRSI